MTVFLADADVTLLHGDVLDVLRGMEAESVDCVVTSPPYWGLRSYLDDGHDDKPLELGLEATPELFVERLVAVFREVRRVLAPHGTVWCNLGDSYFGTGRGPSDLADDRGFHTNVTRDSFPLKGVYTHDTLKSKDLVGIPWRVAFALQADGWWLRSDIVWAKPNPMPESVTDRPTKSHEYVFMLTKASRYFFDQEAVREKWEDGYKGRLDGGPASNGRRDGRPNHGGFAAKGPDGRRQTKAELTPRNDGDRWNEADGRGFTSNGAGRNIRSVWTVATQPFSGRELFGGDGRIPSPDCPVHGDRSARAPTAPRGERAGAPASRTQRSDGRPDPEQLDGPAPTGLILEPDSVQSSSDSPPRASTATAIPSSTQTHKTSSRSDERGTPSEETPGRTPGSAPSHGTPALDGFDSHGSSETDDRTSRTSGLTGGAYSPPGQSPHGNARGKPSCTCKYIDHFATYPEELVRRCVLAGSPERVCVTCGEPSKRIVDGTKYEPEVVEAGVRFVDESRGDKTRKLSGPEYNRQVRRETLGWSDCGHNTWRPGRVLDPFVGSGTSCKVARDHGRHSIGIDLNAAYLELAAKRLQQQSLFSEPVSSPADGVV